jgi:hypothetical protein
MMNNALNRRRFLQGTSAAVIAVAVGAGSGLVAPSRAWAVDTQSINGHAAMTLHKMARHISPHTFLGDQYYDKVVMALDGQAAGSADTAKMISDGVAEMDAALGINWIDLSYGYRMSVLESIEGGAFFGAVRSATIGNLYGNPQVSRYFSDEGSSVEFGGWIDRGFDDIGWLPRV